LYSTGVGGDVINFPGQVAVVTGDAQGIGRAVAASMIALLAACKNSFTTGGVFDLSGGRTMY